ncbi:hypothetical protein [Arthrobacter sp. PsM3]|uniref:hypothetical protein n=1 Tax=Arthrobacter sp. PsM3 TaxID=3030531 RepID=UPI00263BC406|nr:hypothetical protein [Arthrobacter sp. PsM3]MDN4646035.1 hypothetical protein [Arthrobacter sp. PsM3]
MVDANGSELANGLRGHWMPFGAVEDIEARYTVAIRAAQRTDQPERNEDSRDAIAAAWHDARASGVNMPVGSVVSSWNRPKAIVGALAIVWATLAAFD